MKDYNVDAITSDFKVTKAKIQISDLVEGNNVYSLIECHVNDIKIKTKDFIYTILFLDLRKKLESNGIFLLCKGCLVNVHPSGRQLISTKANELTIGKRVDRDKVVDIFDPIKNLGEFFSIRNQKDFYDYWLISIKGVD